MRCLFTTMVVGQEMFFELAIISLKRLSKLGYNKEDKIIITTDKPDFFKNLDLPISVEINNIFDDNNIIDYHITEHYDGLGYFHLNKSYFDAKSLYNNREYDMFIHFDLDIQFFITKQIIIDNYKNKSNTFFYYGAHSMEKEEYYKNHFLYKLDNQLFNNLQFKKAKLNKNNFCIFPLESFFMIRTDFLNLQYNKIYDITCKVINDFKLRMNEREPNDIYCADTFVYSFWVGEAIGNLEKIENLDKVFKETQYNWKISFEENLKIIQD